MSSQFKRWKQHWKKTHVAMTGIPLRLQVFKNPFLRRLKSLKFIHPCLPLVCFLKVLLGSLSKGVFERRTSTGSEVFSLLTCLDDIKFVFLSFFTVIEAIWLKICAKPPSKNQKRPLPVDVRRSKTLLLKLPIFGTAAAEHRHICVVCFVLLFRC